jgi:hypothetical protein
MSSRFTKKSLLSVPGWSVNTPCSDCPAFAFRTRMPPTKIVISGTVRVSMFARSTSISAGDLRFAPRALPRFNTTSDPSDALSPSTRFPGVPGYTACLTPPISQRYEEGLSSCLARPCHHAIDNHPAGVTHRIGRFALGHAAFTKTLQARPPGLQIFGATSRSLALRPGDSWRS